MKKRLRKKLRCGEFTEYGFEISARINLITTSIDNLFAIFISDIEHHNLAFGGAINSDSINGYIMSAHLRGSCSEKDREWAMAYFDTFNKYGDVVDVVVGPLLDVWRA